MSSKEPIIQGFAGQVVLVTGGASGIGEAAAKQLAEHGANVAIADLNREAAGALASSLRDKALHAKSFHVDVGNEQSVEQLIANVVDDYGDLHAVINCAGIADLPQKLINMPLEKYERMIRVNQTSIFLCLKHELRHFMSKTAEQRVGRAIVNVSSGAAFIPAPGQAHYTAAKHAVVGLTHYAASEYAGEGIRVNVVCPGLTDTPMPAAAVPREMLTAMEKSNPAGRMGSADEVAAACVWLVSNQASWVNGQSLVVDGGQLFH
ncbi:MAG: SDR family NAD(P)-dependent oxidoreductase [Pseudomonadota bacterium]